MGRGDFGWDRHGVRWENLRIVPIQRGSFHLSNGTVANWRIQARTRGKPAQNQISVLTDGDEVLRRGSNSARSKRFSAGAP